MGDKKHTNRYWLVKDDVYELHFTHFYEDEVILKFMQDKDDKESFLYVSDFLKVEQDYIFADTVEEAMEDFDDMIIDHINDEIAYYEEMLSKFEEK